MTDSELRPREVLGFSCDLSTRYLTGLFPTLRYESQLQGAAALKEAANQTGPRLCYSPVVCPA